MLETLLLVSVSGIAVLVAFLVTYARWNYGSLEKLGIPVAKPYFVLGSDPDGHRIVYQQRDMERFRKYGPVFGVYDGRTPRVFVLDPDMIRRIMVKDFDHFYDRTVPNWGHEVWNNRLDFLPGEKWKMVRTSLMPMFTTSRIRSAGKLYTQLMDKYVKELRRERRGDSVKIDLKQFMTPAFVQFTSENFLSMKLTGYIKDNYIYKMVVGAMNEGDRQRGSVFSFICKIIPPIVRKIFSFFRESERCLRKFFATLDQVIKTRKIYKTDTPGGKDFIDVMIAMLDNVESPEYKRLGINKVTVQAQAFEMFVAGFDPIVGTLCILSYYLAKNPDIQEKVLEEIDQYYNLENTKVDAAVPDLPYLTACIKEAIRLSPAFPRIERICMKEWTYRENGINVTIPKGMNVTIPVWATNRNPEAYKYPEEFRPERFYKNDNGIDGSASTNCPMFANRGQKILMQYAMTSFGHGPRNCPGSKMGIELVKAGMARILQEFKFECRADTKAEIQKGISFATRYKPIYVNVVKRRGKGTQHMHTNLLFTLIKLV